MPDDGQTPCYAGYCKSCDGMVAVTVAPVENPVAMADALKSRREFEEAGLIIRIISVAEVRAGALTGHMNGCPAKPIRDVALPFEDASDDLEPDICVHGVGFDEDCEDCS